MLVSILVLKWTHHIFVGRWLPNKDKRYYNYYVAYSIPYSLFTTYCKPGNFHDLQFLIIMYYNIDTGKYHESDSKYLHEC